MSSSSSMPRPSNSPPFPPGRGFCAVFLESSIGGICCGTSLRSPARWLGSRMNAKLLIRVEIRILWGHASFVNERTELVPGAPLDRQRESRNLTVMRDEKPVILSCFQRAGVELKARNDRRGKLTRRRGGGGDELKPPRSPSFSRLRVTL